MRALQAILIAICATLGAQPLPAQRALPAGLAFRTEHEGKFYVFDTATKVATVIDLGSAEIGSLAYSAAARLLAFEGTTDHHEPSSLFLMDATTGARSELASPKNGPELYNPVFDPAGQNLFAAESGVGLRRYNLVSRKWSRLLVVGTGGTAPQDISFSPSGQRVALLPYGRQGYFIGRMIGDSVVVSERILMDFPSCSDVQWVNENTIVFLARRVAGIQHVWEYDVESRRVRDVTGDAVGTRDHLSISADRRSLIFTATGSRSDWKIWSMNIDGTGLRKLTSGEFGHLSPVWVY